MREIEIYKTCYIGVGSNLGNRENFIKNALWAFDRYDKIEVEAMSSLYVTTPWNHLSNNSYLNCVVKVTTLLEASELLFFLHGIESTLGRVRTGMKYNDRTIDLDILLYDSEVIEKMDGLIVPHKELHLRPFTIVPLMELDPNLIVPGYNKAIHEFYRTEMRDTILKIFPFPSSNWEFIEHTADQGIEGKGETQQEALWSLFNGFCDLIVEREKVKEKCKEKIEVTERKLEYAVVDVLEEIIYKIETKHFCPKRASLPVIEKNNGNVRLKVIFYGEYYSELSKLPGKHLVKAVTYHDLFVGKEKGKWKVKVIIDM